MNKLIKYKMLCVYIEIFVFLLTLFIVILITILSAIEKPNQAWKCVNDGIFHICE